MILVQDREEGLHFAYNNLAYTVCGKILNSKIIPNTLQTNSCLTVVCKKCNTWLGSWNKYRLQNYRFYKNKSLPLYSRYYNAKHGSGTSYMYSGLWMKLYKYKLKLSRD